MIDYQSLTSIQSLDKGKTTDNQHVSQRSTPFRIKMERWNALPAWTHKLALRLIEGYGCTQLVKIWGEGGHFHMPNPR